MLSDKINNYLTDHSHPLSSELQHLVLNTEKTLPSAHMLSGPLVSSLLRLLVRISKAKFILDLGTFTGFSALSMLEALDLDGELLTCEINSEHVQIAKQNFKAHPLGDRIQIFEGSAKACLESIQKPIDLAFLDANKNTYLEYYQSLVTKLKSGGLLIIDDALWKGLAISPIRAREKRMDQINRIILEDQRVENILLPIRNGVNIIYKL